MCSAAAPDLCRALLDGLCGLRLLATTAYLLSACVHDGTGGRFCQGREARTEARVLLVYGNGSCATGCARYADVIQKAAALDVFILEYPGYADREGKPSQDSLFRAANEGLRLLWTNGPVYLVGESLGTGVVAYLAGTFPEKVAGVVLFAPYNRLADVAQYHVRILPVDWLLVERFPSEDYLRQYPGPVAVFVGGKDHVVPEKFGRRLYEGYAGPKRIWEFPKANHGTVTERTPGDWKEIVDFWRGK